jgi:hypothetical protein
MQMKWRNRVFSRHREFAVGLLPDVGIPLSRGWRDETILWHIGTVSAPRGAGLRRRLILKGHKSRGIAGHGKRKR